MGPRRTNVEEIERAIDDFKSGKFRTKAEAANSIGVPVSTFRKYCHKPATPLEVDGPSLISIQFNENPQERRLQFENSQYVNGDDLQPKNSSKCRSSVLSRPTTTPPPPLKILNKSKRKICVKPTTKTLHLEEQSYALRDEPELLCNDGQSHDKQIKILEDKIQPSVLRPIKLLLTKLQKKQIVSLPPGTIIANGFNLQLPMPGTAPIMFTLVKQNTLNRNEALKIPMSKFWLENCDANSSTVKVSAVQQTQATTMPNATSAGDSSVCQNNDYIDQTSIVEQQEQKKVDDLNKLDALYSWYKWSDCKMAQQYDKERNFFPQPGPSNLNYYEEDEIVGYYRPVSETKTKKVGAARSNAEPSVKEISSGLPKKNQLLKESATNIFGPLHQQQQRIRADTTTPIQAAHKEALVEEETIVYLDDFFSLSVAFCVDITQQFETITLTANSQEIPLEVPMSKFGLEKCDANLSTVKVSADQQTQVTTMPNATSAGDSSVCQNNYCIDQTEIDIQSTAGFANQKIIQEHDYAKRTNVLQDIINVQTANRKRPFSNDGPVIEAKRSKRESTESENIAVVTMNTTTMVEKRKLSSEESNCIAVKKYKPSYIPESVKLRLLDKGYDDTISKMNEIEAFCPFCNEKVTMSEPDWRTHLMAHTGELDFQQRVERQPMALFVCKSCNYAQMYKANLIEHFQQQHKVEHIAIDTNFIEQNIEIVTVIPDLTPISCDVKRKNFVPTEELFRCGFSRCRAQCYSDFGALKEHLTNSHRNDTKGFSCPHCNEKLVDFSKIINHYGLHGGFVIKCIICKQNFESKYEIFNHMSMKHPNETICYHSIYSKGVDDVVMSEHTISLRCMVCNVRVKTVAEATEHFMLKHKSHNMYFNTIRMVKITHGGVTECFKPKNSEKQDCFRRMVCKTCDKVIDSRPHLFSHYNGRHPKEPIMLRPGRIMYSDEISKCNVENLQIVDFSDHFAYYCVHCKDHDAYCSREGVRGHWTRRHSKETEKVLLNEIHAAKFVLCLYCQLIGSLDEVQKHSKELHPKLHPAISDVCDTKKCAQCSLYVGDDLIGHSEIEHRSKVITDLIPDYLEKLFKYLNVDVENFISLASTCKFFNANVSRYSKFNTRNFTLTIDCNQEYQRDNRLFYTTLMDYREEKMCVSRKALVYALNTIGGKLIIKNLFYGSSQTHIEKERLIFDHFKDRHTPHQEKYQLLASDLNAQQQNHHLVVNSLCYAVLVYCTPKIGQNSKKFDKKFTD